MRIFGYKIYRRYYIEEKTRVEFRFYDKNGISKRWSGCSGKSYYVGFDNWTEDKGSKDIMYFWNMSRALLSKERLRKERMKTCTDNIKMEYKIKPKIFIKKDSNE